MSLTNPKRFGLNVLSFLTDVQDKTTALRNINLPLPDLMLFVDHQMLEEIDMTGLVFRDYQFLYTDIDPGFSADSKVFTSALDNRAGIRGILFGGLDINGILVVMQFDTVM